jgi:phosphohistidine phosphatase SixA
MTTFEDCAKQRNLTDKGRDEARAIGAAIRELRIPVERVLASPFCRTVETAMLAFGKAEKTPGLRGWPASSAGPDRYAPLREYLAAPPIGATNTVLVGHGNPFRAVAGPPHGVKAFCTLTQARSESSPKMRRCACGKRTMILFIACRR